MIRLLTPQNDATAVLLCDKHLSYIKEPRNDPTSKIDWLALREVKDDLSFPAPLQFSYLPAFNAEVVLRDESGKESLFLAYAGRAEIRNLRIGTRYEWFVRIGDEISETRTLHTDPQPPRMLYVDGISNVRDFGGFRAGDGQKVRQDMIYRTSELDTHVSITEAGKRTLTDDLCIRTDLDIRGIKDEPRSPVLDTERVKWINIPLAAYEHVFTAEQLARYGQSYKLLTYPESYPLIVHCWGGIDRTGTWLYVLGGMLGVSEEDLGLDYEMSSFSRWGRRSRYSEQFLALRKGLFTYGETFQDACTGFMKAGGLTDEELDVIRALLLEKTE